MAAPAATFGCYSKTLLRDFAEADWIAHLMLTTSFAALLNFWHLLAEVFARYEALRPHSVGGFEIMVCYFGPPPAFYPRLIVLLTLLIATLAAFKRIASRRFISAVCLAIALGVYACWWIDSYRIFRNYEELQIPFLANTGIRQTAYLYGGTFSDLAVALLTSVCLLMVLDRLFDGEKVGSNCS
jgi:hypothetical protein